MIQAGMSFFIFITIFMNENFFGVVKYLIPIKGEYAFDKKIASI